MGDAEVLAAAFEAGLLAGKDGENWAGQCPFPPGANFDYRFKWLDGFQAGRIMLNQSRQRATLHDTHAG